MEKENVAPCAQSKAARRYADPQSAVPRGVTTKAAASIKKNLAGRQHLDLGPRECPAPVAQKEEEVLVVNHYVSTGAGAGRLVQCKTILEENVTPRAQSKAAMRRHAEDREKLKEISQSDFASLPSASSEGNRARLSSCRDSSFAVTNIGKTTDPKNSKAANEPARPMVIYITEHAWRTLSKHGRAKVMDFVQSVHIVPSKFVQHVQFPDKLESCVMDAATGIPCILIFFWTNLVRTVNRAPFAWLPGNP